MSNENRILELESNIRTYSQMYYSDGSSPISDEEFDAMVDELKQLNPDSELFKTGWGYDVDLDTTPGDKYPHRYGQAGSLEKCRTWKEIGETLQNKAIYMSLKLDGISVVLYYQKGILVQALTRGDGSIGIDITDKVKVIQPDVLKIEDNSFTGAVRGEILMSYENFDKFKQIHPKAKNPRNSTAGLINGNDLVDELKYLDILVYTIIGDEGFNLSNSSILNMTYVVSWLHRNFNRKVAPYAKGILTEENDEYKEALELLRDDWYGTYPADGIVLTSVNLIGNVSSYEIVYNAKAFKFPAESKTTEVLDVEWNLSKTRYLIPKVRLSTVQLSGTAVSYATAYNAKYILDNNISKGCIVEVTKSGEIIPKITKVILSGEANIPTYCPECGSELKWSGVHLQCVNEICGNAAIQDLLIWLQNIAPVDGLGDSIKLKFLEQMFGKDLSVESVMNQKSKFGFMMFAKGGHKQLMSQMFNRLYGFDNSKIDLVDALLALNIPRLGEVTSRKLSGCPNVIKTLIDYPDLSFGNWFDMLSSIVGEATTNSLYENQDKLLRLKLIEDRIDWHSELKIEEKGKVAITGKLSVKRSDFEKELRRYGYTPAEISKDTKFLITDDPDSNSSKNIKANEWGITKITEQEFRSKYM